MRIKQDYRKPPGNSLDQVRTYLKRPFSGNAYVYVVQAVMFGVYFIGSDRD